MDELYRNFLRNGMVLILKMPLQKVSEECEEGNTALDPSQKNTLWKENYINNTLYTFLATT